MLIRASLTLALVIATAFHPVRARAAGDVRVTQVGSLLRITGDAKANRISIVWDDAPPWYDGRGALAVGSVDGVGTINGGTDIFFGVGLTRMIVDLGPGDDTLALVDVGFALLQSLRIDTGNGNDWIGGEDSGAGILEIVTGSGADAVSFNGGGCGSCTIRSGAGADDLSFNSFAIGGATLEAGPSDDRVSLCSQVWVALDLRAGAGNDAVDTCGIFDGDARLDGGSGIDLLTRDLSTFNGDLKIVHFEQ